MQRKRTIKQRVGGYLIPRLPVTTENFNVFRFEMQCLRINLNNSLNPFAISKIRRQQSKTGLSVNIGSGPFGKESWTNVDMFPHQNVALVYDCRKKLPFTAESVDRLRCEHVFEHLDNKDEAPKFLKECQRCLRTGGTMRIVVPDLELFIHAYCDGTGEAWKKLGYDLNNLPGGLETPMDILNYTFRQSGEHKYGYDFQTLHNILQKAGFSVIKRMSWGKSLDPLLEDDQENHKGYSLYVDCVK